jgi:hypothetical protein
MRLTFLGLVAALTAISAVGGYCEGFLGLFI